jgi:hypothetical protein
LVAIFCSLCAALTAAPQPWPRELNASWVLAPQGLPATVKVHGNSGLSVLVRHRLPRLAQAWPKLPKDLRQAEQLRVTCSADGRVWLINGNGISVLVEAPSGRVLLRRDRTTPLIVGDFVMFRLALGGRYALEYEVWEEGSRTLACWRLGPGVPQKLSLNAGTGYCRFTDNDRFLFIGSTAVELATGVTRPAKGLEQLSEEERILDVPPGPGADASETGAAITPAYLFRSRSGRNEYNWNETDKHVAWFKGREAGTRGFGWRTESVFSLAALAQTESAEGAKWSGDEAGRQRWALGFFKPLLWMDLPSGRRVSIPETAEEEGPLGHKPHLPFFDDLAPGQAWPRHEDDGLWLHWVPTHDSDPEKVKPLLMGVDGDLRVQEVYLLNTGQRQFVLLAKERLLLYLDNDTLMQVKIPRRAAGDPGLNFP